MTEIFTKVAELMRAIDAYAYDYHSTGKLSASRHTVQIAIHDALSTPLASRAGEQPLAVDTRTSDYAEGYRDGHAKGLIADREYTYKIARLGGISRPEMHPATADLVMRFGDALRDKLAAAEKKYGYSDGWLSPDWMDECRAKLLEHVAKGDPRDVAAYCAFLWHHGESTAAPGAAIAAREQEAPETWVACPECLTGFIAEEHTFEEATPAAAIPAAPSADVSAWTYRHNVLTGIADWLETRGATSWAKQFGYSGLMRSWSEDLRQIDAALAQPTTVQQAETSGWVPMSRIEKLAADIQRAAGAERSLSLVSAFLRDCALKTAPTAAPGDAG